jgi:hypothetical protein
MGDTLQQATDPLQETLSDPVQTVNQTVQQTVGDPVQTVGNTVEEAAGNTVQPVADAVEPVTDAVGNVTQPGTSIVDSSTSTVAATVEQTVEQSGAVIAGAGDAIGKSAEQVTEASAPLAQKVATMVEPTAPGGLTDTTPVLSPNASDYITIPPTGITEGGEPVSGAGGIFDGAPFGGAELVPGAQEAFIIYAAVVTAAGAAIAVRPSAVATAQFYLANARRIPAVCGGVTKDVIRQASAAAAGTARLAAVGASVPGRAAAGVADLTEAVQEGFRRGVDRGGPGGAIADDGDDANDIRLLMQIGMLLGMAYVAFLTVWFWATRLRWSPRT